MAPPGHYWTANTVLMSAPAIFLKELLSSFVDDLYQYSPYNYCHGTFVGKASEQASASENVRLRVHYGATRCRFRIAMASTACMTICGIQAQEEEPEEWL
jgi:hypothetical protein